MRVHMGQTHSPQESRHGLTLSPAWDQAIILSNRGPVSLERGADGVLRSRRSSGGLVTALEPLVTACRGTWVSCVEDGENRNAAGILHDGATASGYRLQHVHLATEEYRGYYYGFANEGLWPLCHSVGVQPQFRPSDYFAYRSVNRRCADAVAGAAVCPAPLILVQDYHFGLVPSELRNRLPAATIVAFWHIPWPTIEVLQHCPWARQLVGGLLGSDIAGFQTPSDCTHFMTAAEELLEADVDFSNGTILYRGRRTQVTAYPVGVEWHSEVVRTTPPVAHCREHVRRALGLAADSTIGVGVDRLDYTKGINEKLLAIERLLEQQPALQGHFAFVQIAEPSRDCLPEYRSARQQLVATARRVNARFGDGASGPIVLRESHHSPHEVYQLYRAADFCYVGSLRDGMNLVAKEFVCARNDEHGVLVLSDGTGAALQLRDALLFNPCSIESATDALRSALAMPQSEQMKRMRRLRVNVAGADAGWWAGRILADAEAVRNRGNTERPQSTASQLSA